MSSHRIEEGSRLSGQMVGKLVTLIHVPNQRLFKTKEAAQYLGIHEDTLRTYADLGQITARRINNRRVFILEDLDAFIDSLPCYDSSGGKPGGKEISNGS